MDELGETIDALVIGGYWGSGHRGGRHSSFLVGVRDDTVANINGQPTLASFLLTFSESRLTSFSFFPLDS